MRRALLVAATLVALAGPAAAGGTGVHVVVIANEESEGSKAVADHYVAKRRLPPGRVCRVRLRADAAELTLDEARGLERALRAHLLRERLDAPGEIRYLVLTPGVPVRVAVPGGHMATTAFLMAIDTPLAGRLQPRVPDEAMASPIAPGPGQRPDLDVPVVGDDRRGAPLRLATHLVGYTVDDAKGLVDRGAACDHTFPTGLFAFQDSNKPADFRDGQFDEAMEVVRSLGATVERFAVGKAPSGRDLVAYLSGGAYSALTPEQIRANRYPPGAIADMLESFGAVPGNFVPGAAESQRSVAHFVAAGITGVHGAVQEPYAHVFPHALVVARYRLGYDLAESFHATIPYLAWQNLVIGDPLARPFAPKVTVAATIEGGGNPVGGTARVRVTASTARKGSRVDTLSLWLDGVRVGRQPDLGAEEHAFDVDFDAVPDGPHELRAVAEEGAPAVGCGETILPIVVRGAAGRVLAIGPRAGEPWDVREPLRVVCGTPAAARDAAPVLEAKGAGGAWTKVAATVRVEGSTALVIPAKPPDAGAVLRVRATSASGPREQELRAAPAIALEALAATSTSGQGVTFRATEGGAEPWTRPLFVVVDDPRAEGALPALLRPKSDGSFRLTLARAGVRELRATDLATGVEAVAKVTIVPGEPARLEVRCPTPVETGKAVRIRIQAFDANENLVPIPKGTARIFGPGRDAPPPVPLDADGWAEASFEQPGRRKVEVRVAPEQGGDELAGETTAEVDVVPAGLSPWLVAGPWPSLVPRDPRDPKDALSAVLDPRTFDAKRLSPMPGKVDAAGKDASVVWTTVDGGIVDFGRALPDVGGDAWRASAAFLRVKGDGGTGDGTLAIAAEGEVAVFWDGRRLEGPTTAKDLASELAFPVRVTTGTHGLLVVVVKKGKPGRLRAALRAPAGNDLPGASVVGLARGAPPDVRSVKAEHAPKPKTGAVLTIAFSTSLDPVHATDPARYAIQVDGKPVAVASLERRYDAPSKSVVFSNLAAAAHAKIDVTVLSARAADGAEATSPVSKSIRLK